MNADGSYRGPFPGARMSGSEEDYQRHVAYADAVLGRSVARLKAAGKYDDAMIIVTADHGWTPNLQSDSILHPARLLRVPLVMKMPGQTTARRVEERVKNSSLRGLIAIVTNGT